MSPLNGTIHGIITGGLAGTHADPGAPPVLVAPATAEERNTIRPPLMPLACWKIEDLRFETGWAELDDEEHRLKEFALAAKKTSYLTFPFSTRGLLR